MTRIPKSGPRRLEGETEAAMMRRWKREADALEEEIASYRALVRNLPRDLVQSELRTIDDLERRLCGYCC